MALLTILAAAQDGNYFANIAKACGISADDAKASLEKLYPAIAAQLKIKAQNDQDEIEIVLQSLRDLEEDLVTEAEPNSKKTKHNKS